MRAQEQFEQGRKAYERGDLEEARRGFDLAIDTLLSTPENAPDRARIERRLEQIADKIYRYDVNGMGSGEDWDKVVYDKSPLDGLLDMTFPADPRLKPKVAQEIKGTVSQLPLEMNDSVVSYIHYFATTDRGRKTLIGGLRRAGRYKPMIERILAEEGVPRELIFLAQAESGFLPRAVSYRQAAGMWQFVSWRGREYGLDQGSGFDERLDPEKATRAAARHLRDLYNQFGDWYLAMAAYNCGPGCVDRAVQRTGYADFFRLAEMRALPRETMNYVPLILAMTIVSKNAKDYGIEDIDAEAPLEYETVKLSAPTSLNLVADASDSSVAEIRNLNPSVLKAVAPAGYELRVPTKSVDSVRSALDSIPASRRASWRMHRVGAGETVATIAKQYRISASSIADANSRSMDDVSEGDVLIVPAAFVNDDAPAKALSSAKGKRGKAVSSSHRSSSKRSVASWSSRRSTPTARASSNTRVKTAALRRVASTR
jgi:membrane-bound lytic murein transglycosylase D